MANHKSAKKRSIQTIKRTLANKVKTTEVRSIVKNLRTAVSSKDRAKSMELLPKAQKLLAKLAQKGVIKRETAARTTGRLTTQVNKLK